MAGAKREGGGRKREGGKRGGPFHKKGKKAVISGVGIGILCTPFSFRVRSDGSIFRKSIIKKDRSLKKTTFLTGRVKVVFELNLMLKMITHNLCSIQLST